MYNPKLGNVQFNMVAELWHPHLGVVTADFEQTNATTAITALSTNNDELLTRDTHTVRPRDFTELVGELDEETAKTLQTYNAIFSDLTETLRADFGRTPRLNYSTLTPTVSVYGT